jgi:hypothetical protein
MGRASDLKMNTNSYRLTGNAILRNDDPFPVNGNAIPRNDNLITDNGNESAKRGRQIPCYVQRFRDLSAVGRGEFLGNLLTFPHNLACKAGISQDSAEITRYFRDNDLKTGSP